MSTPAEDKTHTRPALVTVAPQGQDPEKQEDPSVGSNTKDALPSSPFPNEKSTEVNRTNSEIDVGSLTPQVAAVIALSHPTVTLPGRNTIITRLRYALLATNIFVPAVLESLHLVRTGPWLTILAVVLTGLSTYQLNTQLRNAEKLQVLEDEMMEKLLPTPERGGEYASIEESVLAGVVVRTKNDKYMKVMRLEIISTWVGAATWGLVTVLWAILLTIKSLADERHLAAVGCSALELGLCIAVAVLMTRYRRAAEQEIKAWEAVMNERRK